MRWSFPVGAFVATFLFYLAGADEFVGFGMDDAHYVEQARRFARGDLELASPYFPVGYPAFLSLSARFAPDVRSELAIDKAISALFAAGAVLLVFRLAVDRLGMPRSRSLLLAALTAVSPRWAYLGCQVLAEAPFCFFSLLFLHLYLGVRGSPSIRPAALVALGASIVAAAAMRTIALALLLAVVADQGVEVLRGRGRRRALALLGVPIVALGLWCGFVDGALPYQFAWKIYPGTERALQGWEAPSEPLPVRFVRSLAANLYSEVGAANLPALDTRAAGRLAKTPHGAWGLGLVRGGLLALLALGLRERLARGRVLALYWLISLSVFSIQVWPVGKFLVPLTPLSIDLLLAGAWSLAQGPRTRVAGGAALALVVLACGASSLHRSAAAIRSARSGGLEEGGDVARALLRELDEASRLAPKDASVGVSWPSPYVGAVYHPGGPKYVPALRLGRAREFDYLFLQGCRPGDDLPASLRSIWPGATDEEVRWVDERAVLVRESPCGRFRLYRLDHGGE